MFSFIHCVFLITGYSRVCLSRGNINLRKERKKRLTAHTTSLDVSATALLLQMCIYAALLWFLAREEPIKSVMNMQA